MLLLLVLLAVLLGSVPVFASDANVQIKVGESAISLTSYTGSTWDNFKNKNVYVANVPAGTTAVDICLNYEGSLNRYDDDYDIWSTEISANQWSTQTLSHYPFSSEAFPNITDGTNYYIIACQDSDYLWTDIILVHVGGGAEPEPSLSPEQKKPLSDLLATVADGNNKYYQSGDRYNGKSADTITDQKSGFWAQFTADKGPRANAQKVLETATTEEQINTAVTELKEAIDKLIPASQLNATYLYETLQTYQRSEGDLAQYNALTDKQKNAIGSLVYQKLLAAEAALKNQQPGEETNYSEYLRKALANIKKTVPTPTIGSSSGEWAVLALARGNADVLNSYYDGYYARVVAYVRDNISSGKLNADKSTDNARIALALTAIGEDPTSVGGHNLLTALNDLSYVKKQGSNGPIWALIALDSKNYTSSSRDALIEAILDGRTNDGGWALDGNATDVDMTAMAIQALAPYYNKSNKTVKDAVDTALAWLSTKQNSDGGFSSWGKANAESCAQVIVALSALNIDADTDSRFVKNGHSALENLLTFEQADGSFLHTLPGSDKDNNQMSSEQGTYALVAYDRFKTGKNSLYNMTDAVKRADASAQEVIDMINQIGYVDESSYNAIAEARNAYNKLSAADKAKVENYNTLTAAEASYKAILKQKQTDQYRNL